MNSFYDGNCSSYWAYSPYSYGHSLETSSSTSSSFIESPPMATSSPRSMIMHQPIYEPSPPMPCYYYHPEPVYYPPVAIPERPSSTNLPNRLQYTVRQRWLLNAIYEYVPYPNSVQKNVIADRIGATREQIRIWFQNRRRLAVQGHRGSSQRSLSLPIDNIPAVQLELDGILLDLDAHKNAPQRMPIGQRSTRRLRQQRK